LSRQALEWVKGLDGRLRGAPRAVLLILADHANSDDLTWPSERTIANESGVSYAYVRRLLPAFVALKVIEEQRPARGPYPARYRLLYPEPDSLPTALPSSALEALLLGRYSVELGRYSVAASALPSSAKPQEPHEPSPTQGEGFMGGESNERVPRPPLEGADAHARMKEREARRWDFEHDGHIDRDEWDRNCPWCQADEGRP
jgi:hypothetical protein